MAKEFTTGSVTKAIFTLSVPLILAQILQSAYQITDTFWVGRLGEAAVAAVSISFPIIFLVMSFAIGLALGGAVIVAHAWGRKDYAQAEHTGTQTMTGLFLASVLFTVLGHVFAPAILKLLGASPEVLPLAISYARVMFLGTPFLFIFFGYQSISRSVGEVKVPMYIVLGTVILNLILDPVLIYGWKSVPAFGVAGAAWASFATQGFSAVVALVILMRGAHGIRLHWKDVPLRQKIQKKIFAIGIPSSIDHIARSLAMIGMVWIAADLGTTVLASYGVGLRMYSFIIIPAVGASIAASTLVGQNIGANKPERATEAADKTLKLSFWILTAIGAIVFFLSTPILRLFVPGEEAVIQLGAQFLKIMALSFGLLGVQMVVAGAFRGAGHTGMALAATLITVGAIQLPAAYLLSHTLGYGAIGLFVGFLMANVMGAAILYIWYRRGTWKIPVESTF